MGEVTAYLKDLDLMEDGNQRHAEGVKAVGRKQGRAVLAFNVKEEWGPLCTLSIPKN